MNIVPFESGKIPAYLKQFRAGTNADLTTLAGGGFPVISIRGKAFAVVKDGERKILPNPKDPESPATSIDVVLLASNKGYAKVFYLKGYDKDSEGTKPDCYSNNGVEPAADAQNPQAKKCATCPHNQWGSGTSDRGASKRKACSDSKRLAVSAGGQINDPMLLRVPPGSLRALGEYAATLDKRGFESHMVLTKVGFDADADASKLTFKPIGLLDEEAMHEVMAIRESDVVQDIIGSKASVSTAKPAEPVKISAPAKEEAVAADADEDEPPAPKKKAKPAVVAGDDLDLEIDGLSFDD